MLPALQADPEGRNLKLKVRPFFDKEPLGGRRPWQLEVVWWLGGHGSSNATKAYLLLHHNPFTMAVMGEKKIPSQRTAHTSTTL